MLVYWGLTPLQQPGSYRDGDYDDDDMSLLLVEETRVPGGPCNHRPCNMLLGSIGAPHKKDKFKVQYSGDERSTDLALHWDHPRKEEETSL